MDSRALAMVEAARAAGAGLMRDFARLGSLKVSEKGASDFVSSADLASEASLREALSKAFPEATLVMEESSPGAARGGSALYVDPLDGTTNFLHAIPHFAVSIALEEDGELTAGVVYDPAKDELFWAARGHGAHLGKARLGPGTERPLDASVVATGIPHRGRGDHERYLAQQARVMPEVAGIRRFGAAALDLAYVAAGRFDAFFETGLSSWDLAAGALLVMEAGGACTRQNGSPVSLAASDILAAATPALHASLLPLLR